MPNYAVMIRFRRESMWRPHMGEIMADRVPAVRAHIILRAVLHRSTVAAEEAQFSQVATTTLSSALCGGDAWFLSQAREAQW